MSEEYVILVDSDDNPIGFEEKVKCHLPNGKLHRAFTALLFDQTGRLIITRRAREKMLWPGDWDGTVASHPREGETYVSSAERRIPEELGIHCKMEYLMKFEYHVPYKDVGSENEVCGTLIGIVGNSTEFKMIKNEIDEIKKISAEEFLVEIKKNPEIYCPWMLIAIEYLDKSEKTVLKRYENLLSAWMDKRIKKELLNAIKIHMSEKNWRFLK